MGYTHGEKWNEEKILQEVKKVVAKTGQKTMPTHKELFDFFGNYKLTNAMAKRKGTKYYANILGLSIKECESKMGEDNEFYCSIQINEILGLDSQKTAPRYPYDLLVENSVKIDVKSAKLFKINNTQYFTFNLEKTHQTCDLYVFYCIENDVIVKTLIIPSYILSGKTQLSIGHKSKYDKYIDRWDLILKYYHFISRNCE